MTLHSRIQYARIALYWAVITVGLAIFWSFILNIFHLYGNAAAFTFVIPTLLGLFMSVALYRFRDHLILDYDDGGFKIKKGKSSDEHLWSEFMECSVFKDGAGSRVRLYTERNGVHYDIGATECGVDPFELRNVARSLIRKTGPTAKGSLRALDGLEKEIHRGRAYWIADLHETFRDYPIAGIVFPLLARGSTRPKGFVLSKILAVTVMPNYNVCMYGDQINSSEPDLRGKILRLVRVIETQRDKENIKWSWLVLLGEDDPPENVIKLVNEFGNKDVGIAFVNIRSGSVIASPNQLGRSMLNQMRLKHLVRDMRARGYVA
jgi:hypothetical protein